MHHLDELQVSLDTPYYLAGVSLKLIEAMAFTARDARRRKQVKQVRVAAALDVDQSTIAYFEKGHWPRKRDLETTLASRVSRVSCLTDLASRLAGIGSRELIT